MSDPDFLERLRAANTKRNQSYQDQTGGQDLPLLFRATELAGEVGELLNVIKKMERSVFGWGGKKATREQLLEEVGGVMVTFDLLCMDLRVDIAKATADEFNAVSLRLGLPERLEEKTLPERFVDEATLASLPLSEEMDEQWQVRKIDGSWADIPASEVQQYRDWNTTLRIKPALAKEKTDA